MRRARRALPPSSRSASPTPPTRAGGAAAESVDVAQLARPPYRKTKGCIAKSDKETHNK
jgi:hypothetical protein